MRQSSIGIKKILQLIGKGVKVRNSVCCKCGCETTIYNSRIYTEHSDVFNEFCAYKKNYTVDVMGICRDCKKKYRKDMAGLTLPENHKKRLREIRKLFFAVDPDDDFYFIKNKVSIETKDLAFVLQSEYN